MSKATLDSYEVLEACGKGSFGQVRKVKKKSDGKIMVWKELNYGRMSEKEKMQIVSEVNILRELKNPNIVRYYDRIIDKSKTTIYIVMEYCSGGDIGKVIKRCKAEKDPISEDVIWRVLLQVNNALVACHNRKEGKIFHRDLKPSNIFLDKDHNVKLGDFGLSKQLSEDSTPYYMAPEQCEKDCKYDEKSDIWALGCIIYEMASLHPPFQAENQVALGEKIKHDTPRPIPSRYSKELSRVIFWMLSKKMNERPSVQDLFNVPSLSLRLREKRLLQNSQVVKKREEEYKRNKEELYRKQDELKRKEKEVDELEAKLVQWEKQLESREKELMLPPTPQPGRKKILGPEKNNTTGNKASRLMKKERQPSIQRALSRNNSNSDILPLGSPHSG